MAVNYLENLITVGDVERAMGITKRKAGREVDSKMGKCLKSVSGGWVVVCEERCSEAGSCQIRKHFLKTPGV